MKGVVLKREQKEPTVVVAKNQGEALCLGNSGRSSATSGLTFLVHGLSKEGGNEAIRTFYPLTRLSEDRKICTYLVNIFMCGTFPFRDETEEEIVEKGDEVG